MRPSPASEAPRPGGAVFTVGVGEDVDDAALSAVAGRQAHYFRGEQMP